MLVGVVNLHLPHRLPIAHLCLVPLAASVDLQPGTALA